MSMVCGLDLHRGQITFDTLEEDSGEVWRGRIWKPDRHRFRRWLENEVCPRSGDGQVKIAVEGCTGWRYVVEEIQAVGFEAHVAEPADTQAMRGRKKHAKTDRTDARLLRDLLHAGELPESWIPPEPVLEWREHTRLYKSLVDERAVWVQRIHAELYQHGVALPTEHIRSENTRQLLSGTDVELSDAARQRIRVGYRMIDAVQFEAESLRGPQARPAQLPHPQIHVSRRGLRHPRHLTHTNPLLGFGGRDRPTRHQGLRGQLPPAGGTPAFVLDGLLTLTRPRPHRHQQGSPHPDCCRRREHLRRAAKKRRMPPRHRQPTHTDQAPATKPAPRPTRSRP